ncbi:reverse transcriptase domain-containing protein [Enterovibrio norvegicus]|uniref:reverse transcriptase domain-containing protein n=1 Tax=Enterovibrio norvegicus TaxID=188144 RepID=UPI0010BF4586|nr:reverse transcriptase domain-containing protein [Enterovibrio norvegicus]TKF29250.1 RNA-dependent DNA polymerase [Enterovibrio norvegicus]
MELHEKITWYIEKEAEKLALRHHAYHNALHVENERKRQRSSSPTNLKVVAKPPHWSQDKKFDPFYVKKHAKTIAYSIAKKIESQTYEPFEPSKNKVAKSSGGYREVAMYQIPDAAISTFFYHRLLSKNKHRFSSFSYAYRDDRNVHFAIQDIAVELSQNSRLFVAEFDFSKFFDAISHQYLFEQFDKNGFFISKEERTVIKAFLNGRERGIPQGTSISLFLANLACWKLDKQLEKEGLQFARYADDTIVWSQDYTKITKALDIMTDFSKDVGVALNTEKSEGISILCPNGMKSEFYKSKEKVEFLGYSISIDKVSIKGSSVEKIKREISYILYKHLIQPLKSTPLKALKIPANNQDEALLSALCEIRRYMYGNLSEDMLSAYLSGRSNRIFFKGIMSFYPLINDEVQMKSLDGWLVNAIFKAVQHRAILLVSHRQPRNHIFPFNVSRSELLKGCNRTRIKRMKLLKYPSFLTIYKAMQKGLVEVGIAGVTDSKANSYNYM